MSEVPMVGCSAKPGHAYVLYLASVIAAMGGLVFGYDIAVIAGAILYIRDEFALAPSLQEVVVASSLLGALLGAMAGGKLADRRGRRVALIITAIFGFLGPLVTSLAPNVLWLLLGRIITGVCFGMASFIGPLYIAELAPAQSRGRLVSFYTLAVMTGILISYLVDYFLAVRHLWRVMFAVGIIPALLLALGALFLPESPRWLCIKGSTDQAHETFRRIRGDSEIVVDEVQAILKGLHERLGTWADLLSPFLRPLLLVGIVLAVFRQITGLSTAIFYAPTIFALSGFSSNTADILATVAVGAVLVLATLIAMYLVDLWGRRTLLLSGLAAMVVSQIFLGLAFLPQFSDLRGAISGGSLMLFVAAWVVGPGTVVLLLISEIYPLHVRGLAMSLVTAVLWGSYLIDTITFLSLLELLGSSGTFWFKAFLGVIAWFFVYFLVPETKGISLEEIEAHFRAHKPPRELAKPS